MPSLFKGGICVKKLTAMFLVLALGLGMAGCGSSKDSGAGSTAEATTAAKDESSAGKDEGTAAGSSDDEAGGDTAGSAVSSTEDKKEQTAADSSTADEKEQAAADASTADEKEQAAADVSTADKKEQAAADASTADEKEQSASDASTGMSADTTAASTSEEDTTDTEVHKIGVIVYNTSDEEVIGFREYLQGYIEDNFEMVNFIYSGSISSEEEELNFIQTACDEGVEGFMSFLTYDLPQEVALCEKNEAYYMLASGTVAAEQFDAVEDNPWFLGSFGPGQPFEFQAGADLARYFIKEKTGSRYFVLSGGAPLGNEMHYQRTLGILDTIASAYGASFSIPRTEIALSDKPVTVETERVTVTVCPGYIVFDDFLKTAKETFEAAAYDAVLSVLPPEEMIPVIGKTPLGVVDSYHTRNLQLVNNGILKVVVGKYNSMVGPAFALMLNAVTGYAGEFRDNGKAVQVTQGFWLSESKEDYVEKYTLSSSAAKNAYNFEDLSNVIRIYNPDANLDELVALAEACSYRAVRARRGD